MTARHQLLLRLREALALFVNYRPPVVQGVDILRLPNSMAISISVNRAAYRSTPRVREGVNTMRCAESEIERIMHVAFREARRARLAKLAANQEHNVAAPLLLMFVADLARLRNVAQSVQTASDDLDYTESFLIAVADAAFAAQNCLVVLESPGLGAAPGGRSGRL